MSEIIFITGGARSGKSRYAQQLAEEKLHDLTYLATARLWDDDFSERIKRHKKDRGEKWHTIEEEVNLDKIDLNNKTVVLDCITLWLTNIFHDNEYNMENSLKIAQNIWKVFIKQNFTLIVVGNELGMGIHPENEMARKFADLNGWINQFIASYADKVYLMISGIALKIK